MPHYYVTNLIDSSRKTVTRLSLSLSLSLITHFYSLPLSLPLSLSMRLHDLTGLERPALPSRPPHSSPVRSSRASLKRKAERTSERELYYQQSTEGCVFSFEICMLTYRGPLSLSFPSTPPSLSTLSIYLLLSLLIPAYIALSLEALGRGTPATWNPF